MPTQRSAAARGLPSPVVRLPWWLRWPLRLGLVAAGLAGIGLACLWLVYSSLARGYDLKKLGTLPERSIVYDVHGTEMGRLHGENRILVALSDVSPHFINALLSREDHRFYDHGGIDYRGLVRALVRDLQDRSFTQGASTISMQLARNSFALTGKSLHRKALEIALARRIEAAHTKDQVLELYVNRIFFGTGLYGVERASQAYFGKPARAMTLDEGALLAAIIRGPNKFSPFRSPEVARSGRDMVLRRMVEQERLRPDEAAAAMAAATVIQAEPTTISQETYALDAVRRALDSVLDAEDEVMKMLEGALGPMTALLDKKIKQKMSQHALMQIIKGVINLTLRTVDAATPENEKRVLAALEESGISGKKEKRAGKLSGYTLFTKQMHQDKKEEFKSRGLKGGDVTKEIGSMWKKLSDEEKTRSNTR